MSDERCGAECRDGTPCENYPVSGSERCRMHGGQSTGGDGAPEGNTNSVTHGLYAETNHFYQDVMDDQHRELCDSIFQDYLEDYRERIGDPHTGHEARLFEISVNHIKIIYSDNWSVTRPREVDSGHPLVDKESEEKFVEGRGPVTQNSYSESVVVGTQQKLRREDRQWLKDLGLLDSPEDRQADALEDGLTVEINPQKVTEENVDEFTGS